MSKVTIKFWDKVKCDYDVYSDYYFIDSEMRVYKESVRGYENFMQEYFDIEPHFYKDGDRIA